MDQGFTQLHPELAALLPASLHAACSTQRHDKGARLFATGEKPVHMIYIASGEVVLERLGAQGALVVLQRTRHGFIGEASLQADRYHCDSRVILPSAVTRVPVAQIRDALAHDPAFASRWIAMLNREVRRLRLQCERLSLNKVQERLLHLLETEGRDGRCALGGGLKSLAADLGVTHEALYRCVAEAEKKGLLRREDGFLGLAGGAG